MDELVKRDKKIQQLYNHIGELENLLKNNSKEIQKKEKSNKYLKNVKTKFKEYDENLNNLRETQLKSFNSLKIYLQSLNDIEHKNEIQNDLNIIEKEMAKIR